MADNPVTNDPNLQIPPTSSPSDSGNLPGVSQGSTGEVPVDKPKTDKPKVEKTTQDAPPPIPMPQIGENVQYVTPNATYAAVITHVWGPFVANLYVFPDISHDEDDMGQSPFQRSSVTATKSSSSPYWRYLE